MNTSSEIKSILRKLVSYPSITPHDKGCQDFILNYLQALGFKCETYNSAPVANFFARFGDTNPLLMFAGHTDVVAPGNLSTWKTPPFELHEQDGMLYGRGVADMKGSIVAMMVAAKKFVQNYTPAQGSLGFLITSGEEGDHFNQGTPYILEQLIKKNCKPDYCIVGEPTSQNAIADVIKVGRRGSLTGKIKLYGKQGHVAYPHLADNAIHKILPALQALISYKFDSGNEYFDPTSLQITHIQADGQANNIIPGEIIVHFNIRYSTEHTIDSLKQIILDCFSGLEPEIIWQHNGNAFLTKSGRLLETTCNVIETIIHKRPVCSTSGGTSDGRFIAPYGIEVLELGPCNRTIHQVNESVSLQDLCVLSEIYFKIILSTL